MDAMIVQAAEKRKLVVIYQMVKKYNGYDLQAPSALLCALLRRIRLCSPHGRDGVRGRKAVRDLLDMVQF